MKKSQAVHASLLAAAAAMITGCSDVPLDRVHLNQYGQCVGNIGIVDQRICYGSGGGYYGGRHYIYIPNESAPYYRTQGSPGYVRPWGAGASIGNSPGSAAVGAAASPASGGTVRGVFGGSAASGGGGE